MNPYIWQDEYGTIITAAILQMPGLQWWFSSEITTDAMAGLNIDQHGRPYYPIII